MFWNVVTRPLEKLSAYLGLTVKAQDQREKWNFKTNIPWNLEKDEILFAHKSHPPTWKELTAYNRTCSVKRRKLYGRQKKDEKKKSISFGITSLFALRRHWLCDIIKRNKMTRMKQRACKRQMSWATGKTLEKALKKEDIQYEQETYRRLVPKCRRKEKKNNKHFCF